MHYGRMYTAAFEEVAVTAAQDLFEIVAASDAVVVIHGFDFGQSSDAGDAESEQLSIIVHRGSTSGSGGSSVTPAPRALGDAAFGGTVEANNTTQATEGTILDAYTFDAIVGIEKVFTPSDFIIISPSGRVVIELQTTPGDSLTMSGRVTLEEIGG